MYVPFHNRETDRTKIIAFMREYPFVTLVTMRDGKMTATHLPTLIDERGEELWIVAHLARANSQWNDFTGDSEALVIFQEPHAFISTSHYERPLSVPTWNYVALHCYGVPQILESMQDRLNVVERTVMQFEGNLDQWNSLPDDFRRTKANGIVAFELQVTRLDARFKLSQDRSPVEQQNIINTLSGDVPEVESRIGELMQERRVPTP